MTVDLFNPPEPRLIPASFAQRRATLLDEIERARFRRSLLVVAVALLAMVIPVAAVGVGHDWWFFRFGDSPAAVGDVFVVKTGVWEGKRWELTAYRSSTDGLCFGMTPIDDNRGGMMACAGIEGVPRTSESKPYAPYGITYGMSSRSALPPFIYGPVTDKADEVVISYENGTVVRTPTFAAPRALGASVRFYATQLPPSAPTPEVGLRGAPEKLVGLDRSGRVVACMTLPSRPEGEPLSDCK